LIGLINKICIVLVSNGATRRLNFINPEENIMGKSANKPGGRGQGNGGGWPSGNKGEVSGGGRSNNPPSRGGK
jgi:hypothetical protein